jgi:hypothetical protein
MGMVIVLTYLRATARKGKLRTTKIKHIKPILNKRHPALRMNTEKAINQSLISVRVNRNQGAELTYLTSYLSYSTAYCLFLRVFLLESPYISCLL